MPRLNNNSCSKTSCCLMSCCNRQFYPVVVPSYLVVVVLPVVDVPLVPVLVPDDPLVLELLPGAAVELPLVPEPVAPLAPALLPGVELELPLLPDDPVEVELELEPVSDVLLAPELLLGAVVLDVPLVPDAAPEPEEPLAPEVPVPAAPAAPPVLAPAAVLLRCFAFDAFFFDFCFVADVPDAVSPLPDAPDVRDVALSRPACSRAILCASASTAAARAGSVLSVTPVAVEEDCARLMPARDISVINSAIDTFFISISV